MYDVATIVSVRLDDQTIRTLDDLAQHFARSSELALFAGTEGMKPTRSDMIRTCVTGYLMDHREVVDRMLGDTYR